FSLYARRNPGQVILLLALFTGIMVAAVARAERPGGLDWLLGGMVGVVFIAWMGSMIRSHTQGIERRLGVQRPALEPRVPSGPTPGPVSGLVPVQDLKWALIKGSANGAVVGIALGIGQLALPWKLWYPLKAGLFLGLVLLAALTGAVAAIVARLALPPP